MSLSSNDRCPICHKDFKSESCPHSHEQVEKHIRNRNLDLKIRKIVKEEIDKLIKEIFLK